MGQLDLECIATGLPIVAGPEPRCVFFLLAGEGKAMGPICLPVAGRWNGSYPELDEGWHEAALLERLDHRWPSTSPSDLQTQDRVLLDIVTMTLLDPTYALRRMGQRIVFRAAVESFYDLFASHDGVVDDVDGREALPESYRRAVSRTDVLDGLYATRPERDIRHACARFVRFRRWFEVSRSWSDGEGSYQLAPGEIDEMVRRAERRLRREGGARTERLLAAVEAYRNEVLSEVLEDKEAAEAPPVPRARDDFEIHRLVDHVRETLSKRPGIDALALAGSIEMYRMLKAVPQSVLPAGDDIDANKARWRAVIERVGTADVAALAEALATPDWPSA